MFTVYYIGTSTTDITSAVISYAREKSICSGIGMAKLSVAKQVLDSLLVSNPLTLYGKFQIYELGRRKGTYFIHTIDLEDTNTLSLGGQDASLKLQEYFVHNTFFVDYPSTSDYWIKYFMELAGVSYNFNGVSTGSLLNNNTTLGMASAYDLILPLLQQNGWYMHFDSNNVAQIGRFSLETGAYSSTYTDVDVTDFNVVTDDRMFRNRAIVVGNTYAKTGKTIAVEIDNSGNYANEYEGSNGLDKRAVVLMNSNIPDNGTAYAIARRVINEFSKVTERIEINFIGEKDLNLGDQIRLSSSRGTYTGQVTTIGSTCDSGGLRTHAILNERCPRLFAFYNFTDKGSVYVGTDGQGVWKKALIPASGTWVNFSTGLNNLYIKDLRIDQERHVAVTKDGSLYVRDPGEIWTRVNPAVSGITTSGTGELITNLGFTACTIDKTTNAAIAGYSAKFKFPREVADRSWIFNCTTPTTFTSTPFIDEDGEAGYTVVDLDNRSSQNIISVLANYSGAISLWNSFDMICQSGINAGFTLFSGLLASGIVASGFVASGIYEKTIGTGAGTFGESESETNVMGDGRYVYIANCRTTNGVTTVNVTETATFESEDTPGTLEPGGALLTTFPSTINARSIVAVGNRAVGILYRKYSTLYLYVYSFKTRKAKTYHIGSTAYTLLLGTALVVKDGTRKLYALLADATTGMYILIGHDLNTHINTTLARGGVPGSLYGATYESINEWGLRAGVTDTHVFFTCTAFYRDVDWGIVTSPLSISYSLTGRTITNFQTAADYAFGAGGMYALTSLRGSHNNYGAVGDSIYLSFAFTANPGDPTTYAMSRSSVLGGNSVFYANSAGEQIVDVICGKDAFYFVTELPGRTVIKVRNSLGYEVFSKTVTADKTKFVRQLDDATGRFAYYYGVDNTLNFVVSGMDQSIPLRITPNYSPIGPGGDIPVLNEDASMACLVFDTFYLRITTFGFSSGGFPFYRPASCLVMPMTIGENRTSPVKYTKVATNEPMLFSQVGETFTLIDSYNTPVSVECSNLSSPYIIFGGIGYSGIYISGYGPTGWNRGQLDYSYGGLTYNKVLLDSLHSFVPDVRFFSYINETTYTGLGDYSDFLIFPQPSDSVMAGGGTDIVLVDITTIPVGGNVLPSGTLGYGYALAHFDANMNHVETTDNPDYPFIFVSQSGTPPKFYQKDGYYAGETRTEFVDVTNNLPNAEITVIRCDDIL